MTRWWGVEDFTSEWFTEVVGAGPVTGFRILPRMKSTPSSVTLRVVLQSDHPDVPNSVYVKVANPAYRGPHDPLRREHYFFARSSTLTASPASLCIDTVFDPGTRRFWVILAESGPILLGDDLAVAARGTAFLAVTALAEVHSVFGAPDAADHLEWVAPEPAPDRDFVGERYVRFVEYHGERIPARHTSIANKIVSSIDAINAHERESAAPRGIVHGDYRFDNMMLGGPGSRRPITITGWDRMSWGAAATDLALFLGNAIDRPTRLAIGDDLITTYFDALGDHAPSSVESLRRDIRDRAFTALLNAIVSSDAEQHTPRSDRLWLTLFGRACDHLIDLDSTPNPCGSRRRLAPPADAIDEFPHRGAPGEPWREAWYVDVADISAGIGFYLRFGVGPDDLRGWYSGAISGPDLPTISLFGRDVDLTNGMTVTTETIRSDYSVIEPLTHVHGVVDAVGRVCDDLTGGFGREVRVGVDLHWYTSGTPHRYELSPVDEFPCAVTGTVTFHGDGLPEYPIAINAPGQRSHSWASQAWWDIEWFWAAAHFDDGTRLHGLDVRVAALPPITMGYAQVPGTATTELEKFRLIDLHGSDGAVDSMTFAVEPGSTTMTFRALAQGPQHRVADDGGVHTSPRAWGVFTRTDGRQGVGWAEWSPRIP